MNISMLRHTWIGLVITVTMLLPGHASAAQHTVTLSDREFSPQKITINQGDVVTWSNTSAMPHTVTFDGASNNGVVLQPGQTYSYTFNFVGTFGYYCTYHGSTNGGGMAGTVIVVSPQAIPASNGVQNSGQIQSQAQALLDRVQALQAQLANQGVGGVPPQAITGGVAANPSSCPNIGRVLKLGSKGDDVSRLQQFLAADSTIYPEGIVSGYFGQLTQAAVQRWQVKYNIVSSGTPATTGYGVVGPRTAAAIALLCSTGGGAGTTNSAVGGYIQVSPISGSAPLAVTVVATVNTINSCLGTTYVLNWGDNSAPIQIPVSQNACTQIAQTYQHTYATGGTFVVTLTAGAHQTSAIVTVQGPEAAGGSNTPPTPGSSASLQAPTVTPNVGSNPLAISIGFDLLSCSGYSVNWGDGTPTLSVNGTTCSSSGTITKQTASHTYASGGNFTVTLTRGTRVDTIGIVISN